MEQSFVDIETNDLIKEAKEFLEELKTTQELVKPYIKSLQNLLAERGIINGLNYTFSINRRFITGIDE